MTNEQFLSGQGTRCGLNADWFSQAWHFGPSGNPNSEPGDYYIVDVERDGLFEIVRRFPNEMNDEILQVMESDDVHHLVVVLRTILK